jgi:ATP-binding cassette subfamily F protein 3
MFSLKNITKSYHAEPLFEDLNFQMQKKMHLGFVGRNGTGKTTLFRLLTQKETPEKGEISLPKNYEFGVLEQHIHFTEETVLKEGIKGANLSADRLHEAEKILCGLGFTPEDLEKHPSTFSGGYHLRLNLAKALILDPDCLLLDEPTNYLDIVSIRWLERFLKKWPKEFVIISHDRSFLNTVCTHTMALHRKNLFFVKGSTENLYSKINEEEMVYEKSRDKLEKKKQHLSKYIERFGAKSTKAKQAQSKQKAIDKMESLEKLSDLENLVFKFYEASFYGRMLLEAKDLSFSYDKPLIDSFCLQVEKGEKIAIIGKNARGKSTLLRLLIKDLVPKGGSVTHKTNLALGYFGQTHIDTLKAKSSIEDEVYSSNPNLSVTEVRSICGLMLFSQDRAKKKIEVLSGGERSRVLLAKIIAKPCNLLLLDEPTHHLDMESIGALVEAVNNSSQSVIMVTHDEGILEKIAFTKIIYCHDGGQTNFLGSYPEFLEKIGFKEEKLKKAPKEKKPKPQNSSLKKEVRKLEKDIEKQEKEFAKIEEELLKVSTAQDFEKISLLTTKYEEVKKLLDQQFSRLETLYDQLE